MIQISKKIAIVLIALMVLWAISPRVVSAGEHLIPKIYLDSYQEEFRVRDTPEFTLAKMNGSCKRNILDRLADDLHEKYPALGITRIDTEVLQSSFGERKVHLILKRPDVSVLAWYQPSFLFHAPETAYLVLPFPAGEASGIIPHLSGALPSDADETSVYLDQGGIHYADGRVDAYYNRHRVERVLLKSPANQDLTVAGSYTKVSGYQDRDVPFHFTVPIGAWNLCLQKAIASVKVNPHIDLHSDPTIASATDSAKNDVLAKTFEH